MIILPWVYTRLNTIILEAPYPSNNNNPETPSISGQALPYQEHALRARDLLSERIRARAHMINIELIALFTILENNNL